MNPILTEALALHAAGISVLPVRTDGSKAPAIAWKPYTDTRADEQQLHDWFANGDRYGLGLITGEISGQLELTEIEGRAMDRVPELAQLATDSGCGEIWSRITDGWSEMSPSGGLHWLYRVDGVVPGNMKLASSADKVTLAETRGEHGFVVMAPTGGNAHPTGKPWMRLAGGPTTIPTLTVDERDTLHAIISTLDETPTPKEAPAGISDLWTTVQPKRDGDISPGDDYEAKTDWADILGPHGWTLTFTRGHERFWCRPGKKGAISGTTGHATDRDRLFVFTSSTSFEQETPYTKLGAYAHLNHGDDYRAAAVELHKKGFGSRSEPTITIAPTPAPPATAAATSSPTATAGNTALAPVTHISQAPSAPDAEVLAETDHANALTVIRAHGAHIRYAHDRGRWLTWTGNRWEWQPVGGGRVRELAKKVLEQHPDNYTPTFRKRSLSSKGITDTLTMMATDPWISITMAHLDRHPWELNTPNGIVDLHTGTLGPPDPSKLHTKMTAFAPDATASMTVWATFLESTFKDRAVVEYLQRLIGYSFIGKVYEHILPFEYGEGGNGKSVLLDTCLHVGGDYATSAPSGFLMAKLNASHETEIARLTGARFVICSEVNETDRFDEAKVKELTGGDALTARFMRQDHFTFIPTHHLWLTGNHRPAVESGGYAFWRRLRLIPFPYKVTEENKIDDLQGILARTEGPGILAWIIEGAALYAQHGLGQPDTITQATTDYQQSQDTVGSFLEERCHVVLGDAGKLLTTQAKAVRDAYESWCSDVGERPLAGRPFAAQLKHHGVLVGRDAPRAANGEGRVYGGISIRPESSVTQASDTSDGGNPWA